MKSLTLIKLGGSLITNKNKVDNINKKNLDIVCREIKKAQDLGEKLIIAHGQGSFAHIPAKKYKTSKGIINKKSYQGICEVAGKASQLNRIVVDSMFSRGAKAFSINPSSIMISRNHKLDKIFTESIEQLLKNDLIPILYGDQIIDRRLGCTIFSAEKVLSYLAQTLRKKKYKIKKTIHCTNVDGVYDSKGNIIKKIDSKNFSKYKKYIKGSKNTDVTGGMLHKVEQSLDLAKKNIPNIIINGSKKGNLFKTIIDEKILGTKIKK